MENALQRFLFERTDVRGEHVRLDGVWRAVQERKHYPAPVRALLGEALAATALLAATLKMEGRITLQIQGDGPLRLLVVQCTSDQTLRGTASWEGEVPAGSLEALFGKGRMAITLEPEHGGKDYQGVVSLEAETLAGAIEGYFAQSEQLATRLWLAADTERAVGLLLQRLPGAGEDEDMWERATHLGQTVQAGELLNLDAGEVLRRLFHEEDLRLFEPQVFTFRCSCSRERIEGMLRNLGYDEVREILREEGEVEVACDFCGMVYRYDAVDAEQLFAADLPPSVPDTRH